jgi:imidazolonepropionase-like amidohydrolase
MAKEIRSKLLVTATDAPPIPEGVLVVEDDRIVQVGRPEDVQVPEGAELIDCADQTVLPGLIDCHVHIAVGGATRPVSLVEQMCHTPEARRALRAGMNLRKDLAAGVTTMRDLGENSDIDIIARDAIAAGEIPGPRLLACGGGMRPSHSLSPAESVDGIEAVRATVRKRIAAGADVIKLFVTGVQRGEGYEARGKGTPMTVPGYSKAEMAVAVEEAHRVGIKVAVHALGGPAMRWAMEVGVDTIEHANLMEEDDIDLFLQTGAWLSCPNIRLFFDDEVGYVSRPSHRERPGWWHDYLQRTRRLMERVFPKAIDAGVRMVLCVDSSHGLLWKEAYWLVQLGATPMQAILSVTRYAAEVCDLQEKTGTLEPGKLADIISVLGNPLEDISCLRDVELVMKEGVRYDTLTFGHKFVPGEGRW